MIFSFLNSTNLTDPAPLAEPKSSLKSALLNPSPSSAFEYDLVRSSRRRSLSIEIADAKVVVRAPYFISKADIEKFVIEKSVWVRTKIRQQQVQVDAREEVRFVSGQKLKYLGQELELVVHKLNAPDVVRYGEKLLVVLGTRSRQTDEFQTQKLVTEWYQTQALDLLTQKTHAAATAINAHCNEVSIKATRSKWGHCTTQGAIQYNWQILLAPEAIVDYLVAHEVSHLRHLNHSAAFWSLVARLCPDYKKRRAWLKTHSNSLRWS